MRPLGKYTISFIADCHPPLHVLVSVGSLGGPNAAIGKVDIQLMANCHPHPCCGICGNLLEGLMRPLGSRHR